MKTDIPNELWIAELIYGWKNRLTLARVLINLHELPYEKEITPSMWLEMNQQARKFNPPLKEYTYLRGQVTAWIADNYTRTSNLLWDGKVEQAIKMLTSGKDYKRNTLGKSLKKQFKQEGIDTKCTINIRARSLTNHDWSKCK